MKIWGDIWPWQCEGRPWSRRIVGDGGWTLGNVPSFCTSAPPGHPLPLMPHLCPSSPLFPFPENLTGCAAHLDSSVSLRSNRIVSSLRRIWICFGSFRFSVSSAYSQNTDKSDVPKKASSNYNNRRRLKLSKTNPVSYPEGSSGCEGNLKRGDWNAERVDFPGY